MVQITTSLILALASVVCATPLEATRSINTRNINNSSMILQEMVNKYGAENVDTSPNPSTPGFPDVVILTGCHDQGDCPDFNTGFDMVYTDKGDTSDYIRVNDCSNCQSHYTGGGGGGCYDFRSCNRDQRICTDPDRRRATRHWKDNGDTECWHLKKVDFGACDGNIHSRQVFTPDYTIACDF